ncbi:type VI secretion system protein TssA [Photobacterium makurazakiensis]|uniref:type VI secretion system protein TssA n=1 Tax=Photobacterium makurazakiensis TaxID=2910234 RepID=UPI003D11EA47
MDVDLIDFDALEAPILGGIPTGEDPRNDVSPYSVYFSLKDIRNTARAAERNALVDNEPLFNFAHQWQDILDRVPSLLTTQCKDLEYSAWFIEALTRNYGFKGLTIGFQTAAILIREFWQDLYPTPDEDGLETRIAPLIGLNGTDSEGTLLMPIACIPLTDHGDEQAYSLWEYEQALEIDRFDEDKKQQRLRSGGIVFQDVLNAAKSSESTFYQQLYKDIQSSIDAYSTLVELMDSACGMPLPTSKITKRLQTCLEAVTYLAGDKLQPEIVTNSGVLEPSSDDEKVPNEALNQLNSRLEAINNLKQIAEYFKQTEPHSPMAYAIDQVVRWSGMSLPDLLEELISDGDARNGYFRLVGISSENNKS